MKTVYITKLHINSVRHLNNIDILLDNNQMRPLIITGKNGAGKTSLLDFLAEDLNGIFKNKKSDHLKVTFNVSDDDLNKLYHDGEMVFAYYKDNRVFETEQVENVEKVELKDVYSLQERPGSKFVKYLVDLKVTQALAVTSGNKEKAEQIEEWFASFESLLKQIFDDDSLKLEFDIDNFAFTIVMNGRNRFDFNTLSSGYAAVLDIVVDLLMRMEKHTNKKFCYDMPGIVLIDEIETHLHLEMQKNVLKLLTAVFPNVQFIVTSHSPFILNSLEHAVIYDLENRTLVTNGLSDVPYEGVVEGYFNVNTLSDVLSAKFERFKTLVHKESLSDEDLAEIARLRMYLDEIPDYLALNVTTEYQALKLELEGREDLQ